MRDCIPGSMIRAVRPSGVKVLKEAFAREGYQQTAIACNEVKKGGAVKYRIIDGMHRVTALQQLMEEKPDVYEGEIGFYDFSGFTILVNIYKNFTKSDEIAVAYSKIHHFD